MAAIFTRLIIASWFNGRRPRKPTRTKNFALALVLAFASIALHAAQRPEAATWEEEARHVTIIRDDWGIAHVYGGTDADAVFGMIYAQAEDDFNRVETSYINAMGRLAEAEGESEVYQDLRMKLFIDPEELKTQYAATLVGLLEAEDARGQKRPSESKYRAGMARATIRERCRPSRQPSLKRCFSE